MKVIAGEYKGRRLEMPSNYKVRPTIGKIKEAIFSILMNNTYDRVYCDLFGGTGSLGIEALSRGARFCYFGDNANESIKLIIENVTKCEANEKAKIIHGDYTRVLSNINEKVDVFLLDPPYKKDLINSAVGMIKELDLLNEDGLILIEHPKDKKMPDELEGFNKIKEKRYGKVVISIYM